MSRNTIRNTAGMLAIALAGLTLAGSAFAVQPLSQGYKVAESKSTQGKAPAKAAAVKKTAEGKCGEGKCGDASFAKNDTNRDTFVSRAEFEVAAPGHEDLFKQFDANGDRKISEKEAYDYLKKTYAANGKRMPTGLFAVIPK
ncbi:HvfA family oxazolone/thioamide-modified RiPP metallophore [Lysobacter terrae]